MQLILILTPSFYLNEVYMAPGLGYAQRARQQISATYTYGQPVSEQPGPSRPAPPARPTLPSRRPRLPLNDSESSDEEDLFDWMKGVWDDEWGDEEPPERCENCGKKSLDGRCVACESVLFSSGPMSRRLRAGGVWSLRLQDGSSGAACFAVEDGMLESMVTLPSDVKARQGDEVDAEGHRLRVFESRLPEPKEISDGPLTLQLRAMWGSFAGGTLTLEVQDSGLLKGSLVQPAFASLANSRGRKPRRRLPSWYFTGYSVTQGCEYAVPSRRCPAQRWAQLGAPLHSAERVEAAEEARAAAEGAARDERRRRAGFPFEFEVEVDRTTGEAYVAGTRGVDVVTEEVDFDSGDEAQFRRLMGEGGDAGAAAEEAEGADFTGRPGFRCALCRRRSEQVGVEAGFDYSHRICGLCVTLDERAPGGLSRKPREQAAVEGGGPLDGQCTVS